MSRCWGTASPAPSWSSARRAPMAATSAARSSPTTRSRSFFFQAEDGIRGLTVTGVQTCSLPISREPSHATGRYNLGSAFLDSGRPQDALEHLEEARRPRLDDPQVGFKSAIASVHAGRRDAGVAMARAALADARARGQTALGADIDARLSAARRRSAA